MRENLLKKISLEERRQEEPTRKVIPYPDALKLKEEIESLQTEISYIIVKRDELECVACKNIEMEYFLEFGALEYALAYLTYEIDLLKSSIDRQRKRGAGFSQASEKSDVFFCDDLVKSRQNLETRLCQMISAVRRKTQGAFLSEDEEARLSHIYRKIVRRLDPTLNPQTSFDALRLYYSARIAYMDGDMDTLEMISRIEGKWHQMRGCSEKSDASLYEQREALVEYRTSLLECIGDVKREYPYTLKELLESPEARALKKASMEDRMLYLKDLKSHYTEKLNGLKEAKGR